MARSSSARAMAISGMVAEIAWAWVSEPSAAAKSPCVVERRAEVAAEMADIAILLLEMAEVSGISLGDAVAAKLALNNERYPVAKAHGSNQKYNEF